jgi:transcriptional regulator with XRE-family HTH domain
MDQMVGDRLRFFRLLNNMSREQLATRLDVTVQHVGSIERGDGTPSLDLLVKAAKALGTETANFFLSPHSVSETVSEIVTSDREEEPPFDCSLRGPDIQLVAGIGTWDFSFATGRETWSDPLRRMLGLPVRNASLREVLLERLMPEFVKRFKMFWDKVLAHGRPHPLRCMVINENGGPTVASDPCRPGR